MATEARHHHYIPQCYLRGFTVGSGKKRKIAVASLREVRFFETNPRNVGGVRDFNRIDISGVKPDALEAALSSFEGEVAAAVRNVEESHKFEGEDRNAILNLIALLAVRSPEMRENIRKFEEEIVKKSLGLLLASKDRWEAQTEQMYKAGVEIDTSLSYEDMVEFYKADEYDISMNNEHYIGLEFHGHDAVLRVLAHRKWKLFTTTEENGCFITADRPVVITWNKPGEIPAMMRQSPGFGMQETEVIFPITRKLFVLGSFEGDDGTVEATAAFVSGANMRMIQHAYRQVYSHKRVFPYIGPDRQFYRDRHFMERFEAHRLRAKQRQSAP